MEPFFERGSPEVDEQSDVQMHESQVRKQLFAMNGCELLDGLHLDDDLLFDQ